MFQGPGDLILLGDRHVGIIESLNPDGTLTTIEGDTSDRVNRRTHSRSEATGFVRLKSTALVLGVRPPFHALRHDRRADVLEAGRSLVARLLLLLRRGQPVRDLRVRGPGLLVVLHATPRTLRRPAMNTRVSTPPRR